MRREHKRRLKCQVCESPNKKMIDNELINSSSSYRKLGRLYGIRFTALHAHWWQCLKPNLERARESNQQRPELSDSILRPIATGPAVHTPST